MSPPVWIVIAHIILERNEGQSDTLDMLLDPRKPRSWTKPIIEAG